MWHHEVSNDCQFTRGGQLRTPARFTIHFGIGFRITLALLLSHMSECQKNRWWWTFGCCFSSLWERDWKSVFIKVCLARMLPIQMIFVGNGLLSAQWSFCTQNADIFNVCFTLNYWYIKSNFGLESRKKGKYSNVLVLGFDFWIWLNFELNWMTRKIWMNFAVELTVNSATVLSAIQCSQVRWAIDKSIKHQSCVVKTQKLTCKPHKRALQFTDHQLCILDLDNDFLLSKVIIILHLLGVG